MDLDRVSSEVAELLGTLIRNACVSGFSEEGPQGSESLNAAVLRDV